jgi:protein-disulfide isomerase
MPDLKPPVSEKDHIHGSLHANIELVEYGDYQCPYCGEAYPIVKRIQQELGSRLKFVFRNFPLRKIHPQALMAAVASEAANLQGKYWEMHDMLFENQTRLNYSSILQYAEYLGLDIIRFKVDMADTNLEKKALSDFESGLRSGVNATPTFFVNGNKYLQDWRAPTFLGDLAAL